MTGALDHNVALMSLIADLPAGEEKALVHVVRCRVCRAEAVACFERKKSGAKLDEQAQDLWHALDARLPGLGLRVQEADALIDELLALPPSTRATAIGKPRFHSVVLLEVLLGRAEELQPENPARSISLALLSGWLAPCVFAGAGGEASTATAQARAGNLEGNAHRLLGRWKDAEVSLTATSGTLALLQGLSREKATWWCYLGLLRWEQGRLDEAEPLLRQAARSFGELEMHGQEAAARSLLGLLSLERGETGRAVRLLQAGRAALAPARHPWLCVRAGLGLALCLAEFGNCRLARRVFDETLPFYGHLGDEREQVRLRWLEGRLTARLGRRDEGASLLDRARRLLLAENSLADATLCFLDLAEVLADGKRAGEVPALLREMEEAMEASHGEPLEDVRRAVSFFTQVLCGCSRKVRSDLSTTAGFTIRRLFRSHGYRIEALPYA